MPIALDTSTRPVFVTRASGRVSDADYVSYLEDCTRELFATDQSYVFIYDGTQMDTMPSGQRKLQADWIARNEVRIRHQCRASAFVLGSSMQRGMLRAVHWVAPPPYPYKVFSSYEPALAWAEAQLRGE